MYRLHNVADKGHLEVVKTLLEKEVDINVKAVTKVRGVYFNLAFIYFYLLSA